MSTQATAASSITTALVDQQHVVRERLFIINRPTPRLTLEILESIISEHATGKLTINVSQGGITNVKFEERSQIFLDK
jgi:hypothetical protein